VFDPRRASDPDVKVAGRVTPLPRRIDTVTIPLNLETIELPWDSRQALLDQFSHLE
jgi:hypothetical protein